MNSYYGRHPHSGAAAFGAGLLAYIILSFSSITALAVTADTIVTDDLINQRWQPFIVVLAITLILTSPGYCGFVAFWVHDRILARPQSQISNAAGTLLITVIVGLLAAAFLAIVIMYIFAMVMLMIVALVLFGVLLS